MSDPKPPCFVRRTLGGKTEVRFLDLEGRELGTWELWNKFGEVGVAELRRRYPVVDVEEDK